jgi:hypothetical protein
MFDVVCVVSKESNQDNLWDAVLGLVDQPLLQFEFGFFDLGEINRYRSSRLQLAVHLLLLVVLSHLESPVLGRHDRTRLHPWQALKNTTERHKWNMVSTKYLYTDSVVSQLLTGIDRNV